MTLFGYVFVGAVLFALGLAWLHKRKEQFGWGGFALLGLMLSIISTLFVTCLYGSLFWIYEVVSFPHYQAEVVDVESRWVEVDDTDDNNRSRTRDVLMHTPVVRFEVAGDPVTLATDVRRGTQPKLGQIMTVAYQDGKIHEVTLASVLMMVGMVLMLSILGFILLCASYSAIGRDTGPLLRIGGQVLFKFIVPLAMLGLLLGFVAAIYQTATGARDDLPAHAIALCIGFSVVLTLALWGYLRRVYG